MGPAVAAAGVMAGGMAAQKLMGNTNAPSGGGTPGLTTSKGAGKDGQGAGMAIQVDPSVAIGYFQQAATQQASGYDKGLSYYLPAMQNATNEINSGYQKANATLQPLSFSSNQALNEQMRMLGLDPIQATNSFGEALRTGYSHIKGAIPEANGLVDNISRQMDAAASIKDPAKRAQARAAIQSGISSQSTSLKNNLTTQMSNIMQAKPADLNPANYQTATISQNGTVYPSTSTYLMSLDQQALDQKRAAWDSQRSALQSKIDTFDSYNKEIQGYGQQFANSYGDTYDAGYSADQITNKVTQLPGYQFQLEQGTKAIERQGAAKGMLGSANTEMALQTYGQGQAQSYYNQYMGYLSGITAQGAAATGQISANQANQGQSLAQIQQGIGNAQMETERGKADFLANSLMQSGSVFNQDALFNASAQNTSIENAKNRQSQQQQQATSSQPAYMNAALNQAGFLQGISNSNAYGQGFLTGNGGGSSNYSSPQQNWNQMMGGYN